MARAYDIFQQAYRTVSGLARTVRGPSMSAFPGKVLVDGIVDLAGVFALQFLQARNPDWVRRPFYARFDPLATWLDELQPAFGEKRFFPAGRRRPVADDSHCAGRRVAPDRHAPSDLEVIE